MPPLRSAPSRRLATALACAAAIPVLLAGCSSSGSDSTATTTAPATTTTTTEATTTAAETTTTLALAGAAHPADAAAVVYAAWKANDQALAKRVATPEAVFGMWATKPGDYRLYTECDSGEFGTSGCLYRSEATKDTIQFNMEKRGDGWVVLDAVYAPD